MFRLRAAAEYTWGSGGLPRGTRGAGRLPAREPSSLPRSLFSACWVLSVQQPVAPSRPLAPAGAGGLGPLWRLYFPSPPLVLTHGLPGSILKPKTSSQGSFRTWTPTPPCCLPHQDSPQREQLWGKVKLL